MSQLQVKVQGAELDVRSFSVHEAMSAPFQVNLWCVSKDHDVDFEAAIGEPASAEISYVGDGTPRSKRWSGVCTSMRQVGTEPTGLSLYQVFIEPALALLGHRTNCRLFEHASIPDMVKKLLAEHGVQASWRLSAEHDKLELRTQYHESDLSFIDRLLEEAGISYWFKHDGGEAALTFSDAPERGERRAGGAIPFIENPSSVTPKDYVTAVSLARTFLSGKTTVVDHDFARPPRARLTSTREGGTDSEKRHESFHFEPGSWRRQESSGPASPPADQPRPIKAASGDDPIDRAVVATVGKKGSSSSSPELALAVVRAFDDSGPAPQGRPVGDDRGKIRHLEPQGDERATGLQRARDTARLQISLRTNAFDLGPGVVTAIDHPRSDLGPDKPLLVIDAHLSGSRDGEWDGSATLVPANEPYGPPLFTPKPRIYGQHCGLVVGPAGQQIHVDELGRVRVQLPWDREGKFDEKASIWMRVLQSWAGPGYGLFALPRVGQEVLVTFIDGDPDIPVVVGCLVNELSRAPYRLPEHKTRTALRSQTTPGGEGHNEITFEDLKDKEVLYLHAQRDMQLVVRHDRGAVVGGRDATVVGKQFSAAVLSQSGPPTYLELTDKKIVLSTGEASITLDGKDVIIAAEGDIRVTAKGKLKAKSKGGDMVLEGAGSVKINNPQTGADPDETPKAPIAKKESGPSEEEKKEKLEAAKKDALKMLSKADKSLESWKKDDKAEFKKYFGADDDATKKKVQTKLKKISASIEMTQSDSFKPIDKKHEARGYLAYVEAKGGGRTIHASVKFWLQNPKKQAQILVHLTAKLGDVTASLDYKTGDKNAKSLAKRNPAAAVKNADNLTHFVVNR